MIIADVRQWWTLRRRHQRFVQHCIDNNLDFTPKPAMTLREYRAWQKRVKLAREAGK